MVIDTSSWRSIAAMPLSLAGVVPVASAKDQPFFAKVAIARVSYQPIEQISTAQGPLQGGGAQAGTHTSIIIEGGVFIAENWSLTGSAGFPPTLFLEGTGTTAALGRFGKVTYGSTIILLQRHMPLGDRVSAYAGAGPAYLMIFSETPIGIDSLRLSNEIGAVVQAGVDVSLGNRYGLYLDVKKTFIGSRSEIVADGTKFTSTGRPDPLTISVGLAYRF